MYLFRVVILFPSDIYPEVELLDHMVYFIFKNQIVRILGWISGEKNKWNPWNYIQDFEHVSLGTES